MKLKKVIAVALAAAMVFALAACGNSSTSTTAAAAETTAAAAETTAAAEPAATGVIKVGVAANETGWFSAYDANNILEVKEYADLINSKGGINVGGTQYTIELDIADGQSDNAAMRTACQQLVDDGVDIVLETNDFWMTGSNDVLTDAGIVHLSMYPDFDPNLWPDDYLLAACNGSANDMNAILERCKEMYPEVKTLMFFINDDGNQQARYEYLEKLCEKHGYELVGGLDGVFASDSSEAQLSSIATKIASYKPDAIIGGGIVTFACTIYKELQVQGMTDIVCLASVGQPADTFLSILGEEYANKLICTGMGFDDPSKNTDEFNEIWNQILENNGEEVAYNYTGNAVNCLYEAIYTWQQTGTLDDDAFLEYWKNSESIPCIYGDGILGGKETYNLDWNRMNCLPTPISTCTDGVAEFQGWYAYGID